MSPAERIEQANLMKLQLSNILLDYEKKLIGDAEQKRKLHCEYVKKYKKEHPETTKKTQQKQYEKEKSNTKRQEYLKEYCKKYNKQRKQSKTPKEPKPKSSEKEKWLKRYRKERCFNGKLMSEHKKDLTDEYIIWYLSHSFKLPIEIISKEPNLIKLERIRIESLIKHKGNGKKNNKSKRIVSEFGRSIDKMY